jgi:hypothetical protein
MTALVDIYTQAVYDNLKPLRGHWEPTQPVALGDYGVLVGHAFQRLGHVDRLGINLGDSLDEHLGDQKIFLSGRNTSLTFAARGAEALGPGVTANASLEIALASENSAFFNAADCSYSVVKDKTGLGDQIEAAFRAKAWRRSWVVVTDLVRSSSTTVAICAHGSGSLIIEAGGDVPAIDLAKADVGLSIRSTRNVGYQVVARKGLTPLIGLSQIQPRFLRWLPQFKPFATETLSDRYRVFALLNDPDLRTEEAGDLQFAQLL